MCLWLFFTTTPKYSHFAFVNPRLHFQSMAQFSVWPASWEPFWNKNYLGTSWEHPWHNFQCGLHSFISCECLITYNWFQLLSCVWLYILPFFYIFVLLISLQMVRRIQKMNSPLVWSWWTPVLDRCRNQGYSIHRTIQPVKVSSQKYVF